MRLSVVLDAYGNVVDFDPVLTAGVAVVGLLRRRLAGLLDRARRRNHTIWLDGERQVSEARLGLEQSFGVLGEGLNELLAAKDDCVRCARNSVVSDRAQGESGLDLLIHAAQTCSRVLRFGDDGLDAAASIRDDLGGLEKASRSIRAMEANIGDHMRPAEVVQVLLRIECARLDDEARAPLEALTTEIARTCAEMKRTMENEFDLVEQTHESVLGMIEHVRYLERRQKQAEARRTELGRQMEQMSAQARDNAVHDQQLTGIAAHLDRTVNQLIGALQFQDIVGQRWEHIEKGFANLADGVHLEGGEAFQARLQQAQLVEANRELEQALANIDQCLDSVGAAVSDVRTQLESSLAQESRQAVYAQLRAALLEAADIVRANEEEMLATDRHIAPLVQVAGKMGCQIGDVSHEMRMIALNAQIQAARFGASTGLEVLAEALRRIADQMGEGGIALDSESRRIEQIATDLRACYSQLREEATEVRRECEREFPGWIESLERERLRAAELLRGAMESTQYLERIQGEMRSALADARSPLEATTIFVQDCAKCVEEHYRQEQVSGVTRSLEALAAETSRYTMAAEKQVLLKVAGISSAAGKSDGEVAAEPAHEPGSLELF